MYQHCLQLTVRLQYCSCIPYIKQNWMSRIFWLQVEHRARKQSHVVRWSRGGHAVMVLVLRSNRTHTHTHGHIVTWLTVIVTNLACGMCLTLLPWHKKWEQETSRWHWNTNPVRDDGGFLKTLLRGKRINILNVWLSQISENSDHFLNHL